MKHADTDQWQEAVQHFLAVRRPEQAEQLVRQHLSQHPQDSFAHVLLALALLQQQRLLAADTAVTSAIFLNPRENEAYYLLSIVQANRSQFALAETTIREAIRLAPVNSKYLGHLAWLLHNLGRPTEAQSVAEAGLRYDPTHAECLTQLAQALKFSQQWERLGSTLLQLVKHHPQLPLAHRLLGQEALRLENFAQAQVHYEESLRLAPTHMQALRGLSQALRFQTRTGRLARSLDRYLTYVSDGTRQGNLRAWGHFLLILLPISFLCIPLLLFLGVEALFWRLHPQVRLLRNRPAGTSSYARDTLYRYGSTASQILLLLALLPPFVWFFLRMGLPESALGPGLTGGLTTLLVSLGQILKSSADLPVPEKSPLGWLAMATLCLAASLLASLDSAFWPWGPLGVFSATVPLLYWRLRSLRQYQST